MVKWKRRLKYLILILLGAGAITAAIPGGPDLDLNKLGINIKKKLEIQQGLDLQGGTHLVYNANLSDIEDGKKNDAMDSLKKVIQNRIDEFGVGEPLIQTSKGVDGSRRIVVELAGIRDVNQAIDLIGETAELKFKETNEAGDSFQETELSGKHLKSADVTFDENNKPQISIIFQDEGRELFSQITEKNVGKPLAIYLDGNLISAPNVNDQIKEGKAVITGEFDVVEAKNLAIQLNAGALPVSTELVEQRTIGATLGQSALKKSIYAGAFGLSLVILFMILYYRLPGIVAGIALVFYAAMVIAIFKLFSFTLTLSGIAGFVLSVGMAVDANVLIFERMKEEMRQGRSLELSLKRGFLKAWTSIRDSNVSSLIICAILIQWGSGQVRGFAIALAIGILVSMFSAITISRSFMYLFMSFRIARKSRLYSARKGEVEA